MAERLPYLQIITYRIVVRQKPGELTRSDRSGESLQPNLVPPLEPALYVRRKRYTYLSPDVDINFHEPINHQCLETCMKRIETIQLGQTKLDNVHYYQSHQDADMPYIYAYLTLLYETVGQT